jgi:hypothetical protein
VVATTPGVLNLLAVTALDHLIPVHANASDARMSFGPPSGITA